MEGLPKRHAGMVPVKKLKSRCRASRSEDAKHGTVPVRKLCVILNSSSVLDVVNTIGTVPEIILAPAWKFLMRDRPGKFGI